MIQFKTTYGTDRHILSLQYEMVFPPLFLAQTFCHFDGDIESLEFIFDIDKLIKVSGVKMEIFFIDGYIISSNRKKRHPYPM